MSMFRARVFLAVALVVVCVGGGVAYAGGCGGEQGSTYQALTALVRDSGLGAVVTSTTGGVHASCSYHYKGQAVDLAFRNGRPNSDDLLRLDQFLARYTTNTAELIYGGPGRILVKNGVRVGDAVYRKILAKHENHVHWAVTPSGLQRIRRGSPASTPNSPPVTAPQLPAGPRAALRPPTIEVTDCGSDWRGEGTRARQWNTGGWVNNPNGTQVSVSFEASLVFPDGHVVVSVKQRLSVPASGRVRWDIGQPHNPNAPLPDDPYLGRSGGGCASTQPHFA